MTIGIPKALLYHRYGGCWEAFFRLLGFDVLISEDTNMDTMDKGITHTVDESCLPLKVFMGHVCALLGRCDYVLIPRYERVGNGNEFCVRFLGLYDTVQSTFPETRLLTCNIRAESFPFGLWGFGRIGLRLGKNVFQITRAYRRACRIQKRDDDRRTALQSANPSQCGVRVLVAAQPYILHDAVMGQPVIRMIREQGGIPVCSDGFDRMAGRLRSKEISRDLYWVMNKEIIGAIASQKGRVDGVILLTAFPCGSDSLVNELVIRRVKDLPLIQIILDEQQGDAGLQTRIESFLDILKQRKMHHES